MALNTFGWTPAEVTTDSAGNVISGVTLTVFTDVTKATQVTTLFDKDGVTAIPSGVVVSDNKGRFGFKASDAYSMLYVYDGSTADPWPIAAHEALDQGMASHAQAVADAQAAADSAAASAALVGAPADTAIAAAINGAGTQTTAALKATYARDPKFDFSSVAGTQVGLMTMLDSAATSCGLQVLGDSTGVGTVRWPYLLGQTLASKYPAWGVRLRLWNDATQKFDAPSTLQTGPNGERYAALTGTSGSFLYLADTAATRISGDLDVQAKVALTDWTPGAINAIASKYGGAGNLGWWFVVNTNGTLGLRWSPDGTAFTDATSTNAPAVTDGAALWVRATLSLANSNVKFYTSADGATWTQLGTTVVLNAGAATTLFPSSWQYEIGTRSTGAYLLAGKVYEVRICSGIDGPAVVPCIPDGWAKGGGVTMTGSPTLDIINGSKSGADLGYLTDATRQPKMTPDYMTLLTILSTSHNDSNRIGITLTAFWDALLSTAKTRLPSSAFLAISQNPRTAPTGNIGDHAARRGAVSAWARRNGVGFLDVFSAFIRDGRDLSVLVNADGIHPSDAAGSPLWAATVASTIK